MGEGAERDRHHPREPRVPTPANSSYKIRTQSRVGGPVSSFKVTFKCPLMTDNPLNNMITHEKPLPATCVLRAAESTLYLGQLAPVLACLSGQGELRGANMKASQLFFSLSPSPQWCFPA